MKSIFLKSIIFGVLVLSVTLQAKERDFEKSKLHDWQKNAMNLYQVKGERFFLDASGVFLAGNYKNAAAAEADKIEGYGADLQGEFGFTDMFAGHVSLGYLSSKQKNSTTTTTSEGVKDLGVTAKMRIAVPFTIMFEAGAETALEALKVDNVARTASASSGGTKIVVKAGLQLPSENFTYGAWTQYKFFVQREMELTSQIGTEKIKVEGGHLLSAAGFFEFGSGLRTGFDLIWNMHNGSTVESTYLPTMKDFELEYQDLTGGAYLKVPSGENLLMYIKGSYSMNLNKKRGTQNMSQDENYQANVGLQALF